jgi:predicted site-specific integrase-resolvase
MVSKIREVMTTIMVNLYGMDNEQYQKIKGAVKELAPYAEKEEREQRSLLNE